MSQTVCRSRRALLILLALGALAACGKKGLIGVPEGEEANYQRNVYPDPASVVPGGKPGLGPKPPRVEENEFGRERTTTTTIQSQ
jgi:predicted small lipoprotein YifL